MLRMGARTVNIGCLSCRAVQGKLVWQHLKHCAQLVRLLIQQCLFRPVKMIEKVCVKAAFVRKTQVKQRPDRIGVSRFRKPDHLGTAINFLASMAG